MISNIPTNGLQLRSLLTSAGRLELSLTPVEVTSPGLDEVLIRIEAAPINPSDLGLMIGAADTRTAKRSGTADRPATTIEAPPAAMRAMASRLDQSMPVGIEGAGTVIAAGSSESAQALLGKIVSVHGGAMYGQYRTLNVANCLALPDGATAADGASCFVNPMTALGMVETMKREGYAALVHTAAASNLGQMLNRICLKDGIGLVNVVRNREQATILQDIGARYICDSTGPTFMSDLTRALVATGATLAFDAIGGGTLAGRILTAMEAAADPSTTAYSRYGSNVQKHVYIYGALDTAPTELTRAYGTAWSVGVWALAPFLMKVGPVREQELRDRVAVELKTTFTSRYAKEISLRETLFPEIIAAYSRRATGEKYLINPTMA